MATAGVKFDDGTGVFATNCFPVRSFFRTGDDAGGGAWLTAHRAEQRRRFKAVLCAKPRTFDRIKEERKKSEYHGTNLQDHLFEDEDELQESPVLDGFFLMRHCCVDDPLDLCSINIVGEGLSEVQDEDFQLFENVAYINAGENLLQLESFKGFQALRELELPLNGLRSIKLELGDFPQLELVDLSYNNLSQEDVTALGILPSLKILHLTGNNFKTLPKDMALPYTPPDNSGQLCRFPKLEVLLLDENKISDMTVFATLAGLPRLRHLNLEKNELAGVPKLHVVDGRVITQDVKFKFKKKEKSRRPRSRNTVLDNTIPEEEPTEGGRNLEAEEHTVVVEPASSSEPQRKLDSDMSMAHGGKTPNVSRAVTVETENFTESLMEDTFSAQIDKISSIQLDTSDETFNVGSMDTGPKAGRSLSTLPPYQTPTTAQPPFPELRYLNLAHNNITEEEALLAVAAWPMLLELVFHHNPLTLEHSGPPPLLQRFLHDRLGIQLLRLAKPTIVKPAVEVKPRKNRKVTAVVPKVPRVPLEEKLMLAQPSRLMIEDTPEPRRPSSGIEQKKPLPPISTDPTSTRSSSEASSYTRTSENPRTPSTREAWEENRNQNMDTQRTQDTFQTVDTDRPTEGSYITDQTLGSEYDDEMSPMGHRREEMRKDDTEAFFMTQVDGQEEEEGGANEPKEAEKSAVKEKKKPKEIPSKYKGYEELLDIDDEILEDVPIPKDIQGNIRALKHALGHELIYRDSRARLDEIRMPVPPCRRPSNRPKHPYRSYQEKVDDVLQNLRNRQTVEEEQLSRVLAKSQQYKKKFPEAQQLLNEVQRCYNAVRVSSMKEAREAKRILRGTMEHVQKAMEDSVSQATDA